MIHNNQALLSTGFEHPGPPRHRHHDHHPHPLRTNETRNKTEENAARTKNLKKNETNQKQTKTKEGQKNHE